MPAIKTHRLLRRQLKRFFGDFFEVPDEWRGFIDMVSSAYHEADIERNMLERSLDLSSQELMQANSEMRAIFEAVPDIFFRIGAAGEILDCKTGNTSDFSVSRQNLIGEKIYDIPLIPVASKLRLAVEEVRLTNRAVNFEYSFLRQETENFYEARLIPLLEDQAIIIIRNITDRKDAEIALKKSEEIYTRLVNAIPDVIARIDLKGNIIFVNDYTLQISGYRRDEIEGKNVMMFVAPGDRGRMVQNASLMRENRIGPQEYKLILKNGRERLFEVNSDVLRNEDGTSFGIVNVCRDITDRKLAEEELLDSEAKLQAIFNQIDTGIMIIDSGTQTVMEVNEKVLEMTGLSRERIVGHICHSLVCPAGAGKCPVKDLGQIIDRSERILLHADGSQKDILKTVHPIIIKNRKCYLESFIDIGDRKRAEAALQKARDELEHRVTERTYELTVANKDLKELLQKQDVNIDLAKNILAMINYQPRRHNFIQNNVDLFFTAYYLPCYAEGGDHFFVKYFSERYPGVHKTTLSLKDQSGHEVSCILRSIITDLIHNTLLVNTLNVSLEKTITHLNREICKLPFFGEDNFFTAINAEIDNESMKMSYISAGHPPFLLIRGQDVVCLPPPDGQGRNLPIGILQTINFQAGEIQLQTEDKLIFYTDGLTDMPYISGRPVLSTGDLLSLVADLIRAEPHLPISILIARLFNRINGGEGDHFVVTRSFHDDITLLGLELEKGKHEYEDIVHPENLTDLDHCVNKLFQKISLEWTERDFVSPEARLRMVLQEAMVNAWKHGNRRDPQKSIIIRRRYGNDAVLEVIDEGDGFNCARFYDPTLRENLLHETGRGNFIIRLLTDETYWKDGGRHLISYFSRQGKSEAANRYPPSINLWRRHKRD